MGLADFRNSIVTQDKFSATFRKFDQGVQTSARGIDKLGAVVSTGGVGMLFGATAGVAGAIAIGKTVWSLGELGAQSLTTKASFESLMRSVGASPALLDQLKGAAGGTVSELQLMQQANTALAGSSGQLANEMAAALPRLLEAGRAAAMLNPSYGDAAFMFQSLVTGIKRGSPMLIDNTGITLKLGEATEAYAASIGKSVTELTSQERSIAILRATLDASGTLITQVGGNLDTMTSDLQRSKVAVDELKVALGELLAPAVAGVAGGMADVLDSARIAATGTEIEKLSNKIATVEAEIAKVKASDWPQWMKDAYLAAQRLVFNVDEAKGELAGLVNAEIGAQNASEGARFSFQRQAAAAEVMAAGFDTATARANPLQTALASLTGYVNNLSGAMTRGTFTGFLGGVDVLSQNQYVALTEQRINLERNLSVEVAAGIVTQQQADYQLAQYDKRINDHIGSLRTVTTATGGYSSAMDDLKSKIGSALTPTFDLSGLTGGLLGGMGGDTFDEAYKRLAAVALRPEELQIHAGDWADTFAKAGLTGLTPEDAQARAQELVTAYSKGLDFSLIDREAIKDSVRQAIKAEELYNSVVDEIYAEMGKPNPKAGQAGYALGKQIGSATAQALKDMAPDAVAAMANAVAPSVAKIIRQDLVRYNQ